MLTNLILTSSYSEWLSVVLIGLIVLYFLYNYSQRKNLPPGPLGLPIVGYLPFIRKNPHIKFIKLGKKYGNVFSFKMGSKLAIVLNDGKAIREAFSKPEFLGRPQNPLVEFAGIESPFFLNGEVWQEHRRYALKALRDLGFGRSEMLANLHEEINCLIQGIENSSGKPFAIRPLLVPSMSNNISSLVFGKRYDYKDPESLFLDDRLQAASKIFDQTNYFLIFPWLLNFPFNKILNFKPAIEIFQSVALLVNKKVQNHKDTLDMNFSRDLMDSYLIEKEIRIKTNPNTTFSDNYLPGTIQALFGAGSNTVRIAVEWLLYILAKHQDIQVKLTEEIDNVIGTDKMPDFSDLKNMPYTQAVIHEAQRYSTVTPLGLLRMTLEESELFGYTIPKDTYVFPNIWAVHYDPDCWDHPEIFNPDRFLSSDKKQLIKNDNYMPFSYGKRSCPGEGFATLEVFLYLTSILQNFTVEKGEEKIQLEGIISFANEPKLQKLIFVKRKPIKLN